MNSPVLERTLKKPAKLAIVDCDIHPTRRSNEDLTKYMSARWRDHMNTIGVRLPQPYMGTQPYPRMSAGNGSRMDAYPPAGGPPGSDLAFMQKQHLDPNGVEFGMLQPLSAGSTTMNLDFGAAFCAAVNDWQLHDWCEKDKRLRGTICLTPEDTDAALKEIERCVKHEEFAQIAVPPRTIEPFGRRRYWPLFEAAQHYGLPIAMHTHAYGYYPNTSSGNATFYIEDHYNWVNSMQTTVMSLVMEGAFERFPGLKVVMIDAGLAWAPAFCWRMDNHWKRMRSEVPHVKRPPSEYVREHVWFTTQPIEEPEHPEHLIDMIKAIGEDRIMFSTDYPHWDFDDPQHVFKVRLPETTRNAIFRDNAKALYRLKPI
jgi:predicted TIM-barrel fold metal-dependent hydrolase